MNKLLKQAFTLIELLVVIAIIGILSGLIIVGMNGMTQKATIAKAQVFSNSLRNSLMMNMVGEWKFDGATSERPAVNADVVDSWGGVNNGTIPASPSIPTIKTASNCVSGSCLSFDGIDDYVDCGSGTTLNLSSGTTISLWAYFTSSSFVSRGEFLSKGERGVIISIGNTPTNRQIFVWYANSSTPTWQTCSTASNVLSDNQWSNITTTIDVPNNIFKIYINGLEKGSCSVSGNIYNGTSNYTIGGQGAYRNFNGLIDEVRIYNAAIPTSRIKEQYYAGLNRLLSSGSISINEYKERIQEISLSK